MRQLNACYKNKLTKRLNGNEQINKKKLNHQQQMACFPSVQTEINNMFAQCLTSLRLVYLKDLHINMLVVYLVYFMIYPQLFKVYYITFFAIHMIYVWFLTLGIRLSKCMLGLILNFTVTQRLK